MLDRFVAFDLEMPGQYVPRISAIGITVVEHGEIVDKKYFLVNPECEFDPYVVKLIGITPEMVENEPTFPEIWEEIKGIMSSGLLVAHGAPGDMLTLCSCLRDYGIEWFDKVNYVCTCDMGLKWYPHLEHHSLDVMCQHIDFEIKHHHALSDSEGCAMLFLDYLNNGINYKDFIRQFDVKKCCNIKKSCEKEEKKLLARKRFEKRVRSKLRSMSTENMFIITSEKHPEISREQILGVSISKIKRYASDMIYKKQRKEYLKILPHSYYEEDLLHAILISRTGEFAGCIRYIAEFLPYVRSAETCVLMAPKIFNKKPPELTMYVDRWLSSENVYSKAFALAVILKSLPDRKYTERWQDEIEKINTKDEAVMALCDEFKKRIRKSK